MGCTDSKQTAKSVHMAKKPSAGANAEKREEKNSKAESTTKGEAIEKRGDPSLAVENASPEDGGSANGGDSIHAAPDTDLLQF